MMNRVWRAARGGRGIVRSAVVAMGVVLALLCAPATAIINPNFTPFDLVRGSDQIFLVQASMPQEDVVVLQVTEALKGQAPLGGGREMRLSISDNLEAAELQEAFGGQASASGLVFLAREGLGEGGEAGGFLLIGINWFALARDGDDLVIEEDPQQMFSVWGGSARNLAEGVRYVQGNPWAEFPVRSDLWWEDGQELGRLPAPANRAMAVDLGGEVGRAVLLLSDGGDRIYRAAPDENAQVQDLTQQLGLATRSKRAVAIDIDGSGRMGLLSWDGTALHAVARNADGTFAPPQRIAAELAECLSLGVIGPRAVVVGTSQRPMLLAADADGQWALRPLGEADAAREMGPGGYSVVADFDGNGRPDVMQLFAGGMLFYAAEGEGQFAAPVRIDVALPRNPVAAALGDFSNDGTLDLMVGGENGTVYLSRHDGGQWKELTRVTYELHAHGAGQADVINVQQVDINADGRQGVALFFRGGKPMIFFNRGFACFGWARELDPTPSQHVIGVVEEGADEVPGMDVLARGQSGAALADMTGDGLFDMLAVDRENNVWLIEGVRHDDTPVLHLHVSLPAGAAASTTITVRDGQRSSGMYVVRPGEPATISRPEPGPVNLEWMTADGRKQTREVIVEDAATRIELE